MTDSNCKRFETYRAYDADGTLLYVGMSVNALHRLQQHSYIAGWYGVMQRFEIDIHDNYEQAFNHEKKLIAELKPEWNVNHATDKVVRRHAARRNMSRKKKGNDQAGDCLLGQFANKALCEKNELAGADFRIWIYLYSIMDRESVITMTQVEISKALGITASRVNRAFSKLKDAGIINASGVDKGVPMFKVGERYGVRHHFSRNKKSA